MITALYFAAAISILINLIAGVLSGSIIICIATLISGFVTACLCAGVAAMLDKQDALWLRIESLHEYNRKSIGKNTCMRCGRKYSGDISSCPHCGNREAWL